MFLAFVIISNMGGLKRFGNRNNPTRRALENEPTLNREFFNGDQTVVFTTPGNWLPTQVVIAAAPEHGYRLVNHESQGHGRETLTFERA